MFEDDEEDVIDHEINDEEVVDDDEVDDEVLSLLLSVLLIEL